MSARDELFRRARSFAAPKPVETDATAHRRVAVIDVGSNSVRLVVFDGIARSPSYFFNEKVLCGLGRGVLDTGRLHPEGRERALAALRRFAVLAERMQVSALEAVATAAVREAEDGKAFCEEVLATTGIRIRIASGDDEARIAAEGVLLGWPGADGVVADMGGASMELARVANGKVGARVTTPLGPLHLRDRAGDPEALRALIDQHLEAAREVVSGPVRSLYLVGGSWRALGRVHMVRSDYPIHVLHEYGMEPVDLAAQTRWIARQTPEALDEMSDISSARAEVLPLAAAVLERLVQVFAPEKVSVSAYGLREGLLWEHLSPGIRALDPLIEACRFRERRRARFPGFGQELFDWVRPLLDGFAPDSLRLAEAACLLHDVNWRAHPDYRASVGFETLMRASLGGVDHPGRVFIGLALYHRYKSSRKQLGADAMLGLLAPERQAEAERLGRAMRLGAMLSGSTPGGLSGAPIARVGERLVLSLGADMADLAGEVVSKRLGSVAKSLGLTPELTIIED
ncbi:Ppx/GppA family phosphatase [Oceanicella sp. SM1341]|uniref:Ppx/GppA family phosphatase n=1 Tax=Oceanicella sp. SM1341 TaxID=1548889 RepID=UPI0018E52525|nr:Ppx/GppA family phosphatase [Oceanicella sp. SM1341]